MSLDSPAVSLALQGGASYGAYTWGVLDALLEGDLPIEGVTGASAGAINAVVLADGFAADGAGGARRSLRTFWEGLARAAEDRPRRWTTDLKALLESLSKRSPRKPFHELTTRLVASFRMDSRRMEPLRSVLEHSVDFERLRAGSPVRVFVNATNCRTSALRVFSGPELTCDAVCASACIPLLFDAVEIDGEHYWDGGFLGNPAIFPVIYGCAASDIVLVETRPAEPRSLPTTVSELLSAVVDVSSTAALTRELRMIDFVSEIARRTRGVLPAGVREIRLHRVEAPAVLNTLQGASSFRADSDYFRRLYEVGRQAGRHWMEAVRPAVVSSASGAAAKGGTHA